MSKSVKRFVAIVLAGSLENDHKIGDFVISKKALAEDGVSHRLKMLSDYAIAFIKSL